jgi:hypothetical protein
MTSSGWLAGVVRTSSAWVGCAGGVYGLAVPQMTAAAARRLLPLSPAPLTQGSRKPIAPASSPVPLTMNLRAFAALEEDNRMPARSWPRQGTAPAARAWKSW